MNPESDTAGTTPLPVRFVGVDLDGRLGELLMPYVEHAIAGQSDPTGCVDAAFLYGVHVAVAPGTLIVTCSLYDNDGGLHPLCNVAGQLVGVLSAGDGWLFVPPEDRP